RPLRGSRPSMHPAESRQSSRPGCDRQSAWPAKLRRYNAPYGCSRTHRKIMPTPLIATFGEIMLRLSPPGFERLLQSPNLIATFGGGEANVAVSLAQFDAPSRFITVLPSANPIADAFVGELRRFGVDSGRIVRAPGRMGIYFVETGANQRPSKVFYDREFSAIALARPGTLDWDAALEDATWLHVTGITPALSASAAELTLEAVRAARGKGIQVSCDLNYRKNLWKWGKQACEVMPELLKFA